METTELVRDRIYSEEDSIEVRKIWAQHNEGKPRKLFVTIGELLRMRGAGLDTEHLVVLSDVRKQVLYAQRQPELSDNDRALLREKKDKWA
mgnify:CR=1 FL=1